MILNLPDEIIPYFFGFDVGILLWLIVTIIERFLLDKKQAGAPVLFKRENSRVNELGQVEVSYIPVCLVPSKKNVSDNWLGDLAKGAKVN